MIWGWIIAFAELLALVGLLHQLFKKPDETAYMIILKDEILDLKHTIKEQNEKEEQIMESVATSMDDANDDQSLASQLESHGFRRGKRKRR